MGVKMDFEKTKNLLAKFGVKDEYTADDAEMVHQSIAEAHQHFGLTRLQIGALLLAVKHKELWRGKSKSFAEYLESEHIKYSAAAQYMKVAEKLLFELKFSNELLMVASRISMTTLLKACGKMTKENMVEVIYMLEGLSDRDAQQSLEEFTTRHQSLSEPRPASQKVKKMMSDFYSLPNDLRVEFIQALKVQIPGTKFNGDLNGEHAQNAQRPKVMH